MKIIKTLAFVSISNLALAANVAIVDSGTYFAHDLFQGKIWQNKKEIQNYVDDDKNGKVDDVVGWNFAEGRGKVFYPEHIELIHPTVYKALTIIAHIQAGTITQEEKEFWNTQIVGLPEEKKNKLIAQLNFYGQYAHGTHCSGIVALGNPDAKIMSGRVFPDSEPGEAHEPVATLKTLLKKERGPIDWIYGLLANVTNKQFEATGGYLFEMKMDVANYSLGIPLPNLAKQSLALQGNKEPTPEQWQAETQRLFKQYKAKGEKWINAAPNTLFVIAAGNDGSNNDLYPYFPANVGLENTITIAASHDYNKIADFSNYGKESVDVAAPGVAIMSAVPGPSLNFALPMSGTSMAAPYVTMVASLVKDHNPKLTPKQIKTILMETSDKKEWLKEKVKSSGLVNKERAVYASELSLRFPLNDAIAYANKEIKDIKSSAIRSKTTITSQMKAFANNFNF